MNKTDLQRGRNLSLSFNYSKVCGLLLLNLCVIEPQRTTFFGISINQWAGEIGTERENLVNGTKVGKCVNPLILRSD